MKKPKEVLFPAPAVTFVPYPTFLMEHFWNYFYVRGSVRHPVRLHYVIIPSQLRSCFRQQLIAGSQPNSKKRPQLPHTSR
jgi:hypothetical protein